MTLSHDLGIWVICSGQVRFRCSTDLLHVFFQIHIVSALWFISAFHPGREPAAQGFGSGDVQPDGVGPASEHLETLQDPVGVPAPSAGAALPEHHYSVPQTHPDLLHHPAQLWRAQANQALLLCCRAAGFWLPGWSLKDNQDITHYTPICTDYKPPPAFIESPEEKKETRTEIVASWKGDA